MRDFVVGLGANVGSAHAALVGAARGLAALADVELLRVSPHYATAPVGPPQPDYLNAAARVRSALPPTELLARLQELERRFGRVRHPDERWGPRTLDLDILHWDGPALALSGLVVPHPRLRERAFALAPLLAVAPELEGHFGPDLLAAGGTPPLAAPPTVEVFEGGLRVTARDDADAVAATCAALAHHMRRSVRWGGHDIAVRAIHGVGFVEALIEALEGGFRLAVAPVVLAEAAGYRGSLIGDYLVGDNVEPLAFAGLEITLESAVVTLRGLEPAKVVGAPRVEGPTERAPELSSH